MTGIFTIVLIFSLVFLGAFSIFYWLGSIILFFVHRSENKPIHQYEVTLTGNYANDFIKLLRQVCKTHMGYYGSDIKVVEYTDAETEVV